MKTLLVLALTVFILMSNTVFAQDTLEVNEAITEIGFGGIRYEDGFVGSYGTGFNLYEGLWLFTSGDFGEEQSANVEGTYLVNVEDAFMFVPYLRDIPILKEFFSKTIFDKMYIGPLLGPNFDFTDNIDNVERDALTYVRGAIGAMGTYHAYKNIGAWGYVKRKVSLDDESMIGSKWVAGGGLYLGL